MIQTWTIRGREDDYGEIYLLIKTVIGPTFDRNLIDGVFGYTCVYTVSLTEEQASFLKLRLPSGVTIERNEK